jgi:hypothetical protein
MKQRIKKIIKELKEVITEEKLIVSDNILFAESISTYRGEQCSNKNNFKKQIRNANSNNTNNNKPTPKQIYYIKNNLRNIDTYNLTFQEANKLISEHKKKELK